MSIPPNMPFVCSLRHQTAKEVTILMEKEEHEPLKQIVKMQS